MGSNYNTNFYIKTLKSKEDKQKFISSLTEILVNEGLSYKGKCGIIEEMKNNALKEIKSTNLHESIALTSTCEKICMEFRLDNFSMRLYLGTLDKMANDQDDFKSFHLMRKISFSLNRAFFLWEDWRKRISQLLNINKSMYNFIKPFYGWGETEENWAINEPIEYLNAQKGVIRKIYWLNFFTPKLVEKFGREKLLSAPSYITEELLDGGIMLIRSPNPFTIDEPYIKAEDIEKHLGIR